MKKTSVYIFIVFCFINQTFSQDTIRWFSNKTINENILIDTNELLLIESGTHVLFQGPYTITVKGKIKCLGNKNDSIFFEINDTTSITDTSTLYGGWGGLKLLDNNTDTSVFKFCNFYYGKTLDSGGAIYSNNYNSLKIENCRFVNNVARYAGGAIYLLDNNYVTIRNCFYKDNQRLANYDFEGGAIYVKKTKIIIDSNIFYKNIALQITHLNGWVFYSGVGSAIYSSLCPVGYPVITNNIIANNLGVSGALYESNIKSCIIDNIIVNNQDLGFMNGHSASQSCFLNNLIAYNYAEYLPYSGTDINSKYYIFTNNIIWNNLSNAFPRFPQLYATAKTEVKYSCIQHSYPGKGNISDNPQFVNPSIGAGVYFNGLNSIWELNDYSPCIDAGDPDTTGLFLPDEDIKGYPRIVNGRIDMGPYEYQPEINRQFNNIMFSKINKKEIEYDTIHLMTEIMIKCKKKINLKSKFNDYYFVVYDNESNNLLREFKWNNKVSKYGN